MCLKSLQRGRSTSSVEEISSPSGRITRTDTLSKASKLYFVSEGKEKDMNGVNDG